MKINFFTCVLNVLVILCVQDGVNAGILYVKHVGLTFPNIVEGRFLGLFEHKVASDEYC